jgi:AAA+ superfamily predicted ATPase
VVDLEKARGILMGQWGFGERLRDQQSTTVLLWGPSGTGKSATAEALGFEIGRPCKILSYSELIGGRSSDVESAISSAFKDAVRCAFFDSINTRGYHWFPRLLA